MGYDICHGGIYAADRAGVGEGESLSKAIFTPAEHSASAVGCKYSGNDLQSAETDSASLSPSGLRTEVESAGAIVGLSLPRVAV